MDCSQVKPLLSGELDNELTLEESELMRDHLSHCSECRNDSLGLKELHGLTRGLGEVDKLDPFWDRYWLGIYNRLERGVAWVALSVGASLLLGFGVWFFVKDFLMDAGIPFVVRGGVGLGLAGGTLLVVSVCRRQWFVFRHDPYKEIKR